MCKEENISKSPLHSLPSWYILHVQYLITIINGSVGSKLTYGLLNWDRYASSVGRVRIKKRVGGLVSTGGMVKINLK